MAATSQFDNFFQPTSSIAERDRKSLKAANTQGDPVRFGSKLLAVEVNYFYDNSGDVVFVAEAGGPLTRLRLSTNEMSNTPQASRAPITSIASFGIKSIIDQSVILHAFVGSWDKSIWHYTSQLTVGNAARSSTTEVSTFKAHTDFVKCLLIGKTADGQPVLISGGADGDVRFWTLQGESLGSLRPQSRGIECLVLDPMSSAEMPIVFFSTSQREIFQFALPTTAEIKAGRVQVSQPILAHETSVYKLYFDSDGDLWTASADKTAKHLVRLNGWTPDTTLQHPDFVRDIVVHDRYGLVVTACRDEEVRVWNGATGDLLHLFTGHFEEVTGLALAGDLLISISIDSTLRRWSLAPTDLQKCIEAAKNPNLQEEIPEPHVDLNMLTAEEEAELRALMEDEEADVIEKIAQGEQ